MAPTVMMFCRWSNHLDLIVDGTSAVNLFVIRSTMPWNMFVPLESTSWRNNSCGDQRRTSCCCGEKSRGFHWLQHFHVKETFSVDSDVFPSVRTSLISSWMEPAPSVYSSCVRKSFGKLPCHLVNVTLLDVLERSVVDSGTRLEQHFDATETFNTDTADVSVWELVGLFLVDLPQSISALCRNPRQRGKDSVERAPSLSEVLHEILCKITASQAEEGAMQSVTFVDGTPSPESITMSVV